MICREHLHRFAEIVDTPLQTLSIPAQHLVLSKRTDCIDIACSVFSSKMPDVVARSIPKRQYEFLLGRLAAGILLVENGVSPKDSWIPSLERQPLWPSGIIGSISHSRDLVAVSVSRKGCGIDSMGIDIESLDQDVEAIRAIDACFTPEEITLLKRIENGLIIGFSVKEALYKCLNPVCGMFFDFLDVDIWHVDTINQHIYFVLLCNLGVGINAGDRFRGNYQLFNNHVWTSVFWNATERHEAKCGSVFQHVKMQMPLIVGIGSAQI